MRNLLTCIMQVATNRGRPFRQPALKWMEVAVSEEAKSPRKYLTKKAAASVGALAIAAVLAGTGFRWWKTGRFIEQTDDAYVGGNVTLIAPHVSGYVAEVLVGDNQFVRRGDPLVRLERKDFRALLDAATAHVTERKAALNRLKAQRDLEVLLIRQAHAALAAKTAAADFKASEAARYEKLVQDDASTRQNAERWRSESHEARAEADATEAGLGAARQKLAVVDAQIAEADAALAQTEAQRNTAELNLGYTEIGSPIDGYVGDRSARVGTYIAAGSPLLSVVPAHGLWVDANFKEDQLRHMKPGDAVEVVADVARSAVFRGHVQSLSPATGAVFSVIPPQNATGNFTKIVQRVPVRIALDGDAATLGVLRPGLSTTVSVRTQHGGENDPSGESQSAHLEASR
jgi:membrane fusion protein (multidrug efflux system)